MEQLIERAFQALKTLPPEDRERIAWEIIERVEDKTEWDKIISAPPSQQWLEKESARATKVFNKNKKNLSQTFISIPQDNFLREEPYWKHFDELPEDIKKTSPNQLPPVEGKPGASRTAL